MRQRSIAIAIAAVALVTTSCQKKASGQTVAVVNGEEITASELNAELANQQNSGSTQDPRAAALQNLINRKLLVQQAKKDGLDKSPEYLTQLRRGTDDLLVKMLISRRVNTAQVPTADEIKRYEASHPEAFAGREIWSLSQIVYPLPKDPAVTTKLSKAKNLDEVAAILNASAIQFQRASKKVDTGMFPDAIYRQIAQMPAGSAFIANGPDKAVASVIETRTPNPTSAEQANAVAVNLIKRDQTSQIIDDRVKTLRSAAKIDYQPGFAPPKIKP